MIIMITISGNFANGSNSNSNSNSDSSNDNNDNSLDSHTSELHE